MVSHLLSWGNLELVKVFEVFEVKHDRLPVCGKFTFGLHVNGIAYQFESEKVRRELLDIQFFDLIVTDIEELKELEMGEVLDLGDFVPLQSEELKFHVVTEGVSRNFRDQIALQLNSFGVLEDLEVLNQWTDCLVSKPHCYDSIGFLRPIDKLDYHFADSITYWSFVRFVTAVDFDCSEYSDCISAFDCASKFDSISDRISYR